MIHAFVLPYPPSANANWLHGRGRVYLSPKVREYRRLVNMAVADCFGQRMSLTDPLRIEIEAAPPARVRKRDLSNLLKVTEDALTHAGFWADDSLVSDLRIVWAPPAGDGRLVVRVQSLEAARASNATRRAA